MRDRQRARVVRRRREGRRVLEAAEEVRLLEQHGRGVRRGRAERVRVGRPPVAVRDLDDVEPESRRVRLDDLAHLGVERLREDDRSTVR